MSKQILTVILFLTSIIFFSCSKNDDSPIDNLSNTPTAKSQFDNSNYGIYKGIFVGSSGTIIININNDNTISVILKVDGVTYNFTSNQTVQQNQPTTINFVSGSNSFTFTVSGTGANPTITNLIVNGHPNAAILVVKETSGAIVKCYEGTYTGGETGIFNAVIYNTTIKGLVRSSGNVTYIADGTVVNNQINAAIGNVSSGATFLGTLSGNTTSGTWSNTSAGLNGSWSGTRTF